MSAGYTRRKKRKKQKLPLQPIFIPSKSYMRPTELGYTYAADQRSQYSLVVRVEKRNEQKPTGATSNCEPNDWPGWGMGCRGLKRFQTGSKSQAYSLQVYDAKSKPPGFLRDYISYLVGRTTGEGLLIKADILRAYQAKTLQKGHIKDTAPPFWNNPRRVGIKVNYRNAQPGSSILFAIRKFVY